jgi:hypothetical protein
LSEPLSFGVEPASAVALAAPGTQPAPGSVGQARLLTPLDSATSKPGDKVEAVLSQPVYSADRKLILPEGTHLHGEVVTATRARHFHRSGRLRFRLEEIDIPQEIATLQAAAAAVAAAPDTAPQAEEPKLKLRTQADLQAAEGAGKIPLKIDSEGGVEAKESKTRFLAAAASVLIARSAGDNDPIRNQSHQVVGQSQNVGGRTVGGGFGFGLLGMGIAQSSRWVGTAFGYYGMAWSLYSNLVSLGSNVQFGKNAAVEIRFDVRADGSTPAPPAGK